MHINTTGIYLAACSTQIGLSANSLEAILMSSLLYKKSLAVYQQSIKIRPLEKLLYIFTRF